MFSAAERERRFNAASRAMNDAGIRAICLTGNSTVGPHTLGNYRYFTDRRVIFFLANVVMFNDSEPTAVTSSHLSRLGLINKSFIRDVIFDTDQLGGIINLLKTRGIDSGRVGVLTEILPASWMKRLREELPNVTFVDVSDLLYSIRTVKSAEEIESQRMCAKIADAGFKAACNAAGPGVYENEIVAEMDRAMQRLGAEESFALIASGKFSIENDGFPLLHNYAASNRKIEHGDVVALEITPRYMGYWTQLVRTICVGGHNADAERLRRVVVGAINEIKPVLRAKTPVCEVARKMREYTEAAGYRFANPCGHIAAVDLNEERLSESNKRLLEPGMLIIVHPAVFAGDTRTSLYWGESYLITDDGFETLMESDCELYVTSN